MPVSNCWSNDNRDKNNFSSPETEQSEKNESETPSDKTSVYSSRSDSCEEKEEKEDVTDESDREETLQYSDTESERQSNAYQDDESDAKDSRSSSVLDGRKSCAGIRDLAEDTISRWDHGDGADLHTRKPPVASTRCLKTNGTQSVKTSSNSSAIKTINGDEERKINHVSFRPRSALGEARRYSIQDPDNTPQARPRHVSFRPGSALADARSCSPIPRTNGQIKNVSFRMDYDPRPSPQVRSRSSLSARRASDTSVRPSSSLRMVRTNSSQNIHKPVQPKEVPTASQKADITSFQRSLRLLGFQAEDFGMSKAVDEPGKASPKVRLPLTPTFHTRVMKRSVSLDNIRRSGVCNDGSGDASSAKEVLGQLDRETLTKAVYEEWYFKKLAESKKKKELMAEEERKKKEEAENAQAVKARQVEESLAKWKHSKLEERKNAEKKVPTRPGMKLYEAAPVSKEDADKAYQLWKKEKDEQLEKQKKIKQQEKHKKLEKEKADYQKKADAKKLFEVWKKNADEVMKKYAEEREKEKRYEESVREKKQRSRFGDTKISYDEWKTSKDLELKELAKKKTAAEEEDKQKRRSRMEERRYEADQAFEEWLDGVEERRHRRPASSRRRGSLPPPPLPPWTPAVAKT